MYNRILSKNLNVYSERQNILKEGHKKVIIKSSIRKSMVLREIRTILREPSNFINCVVMTIYMPIFLLIFILKGNILSESSSLFRDSVIIGATFMATVLTISGNYLASTDLSREEKEVLVSKYIPVDYKIQIQAKIIVCLIVNSLSFILGIALLILLKASPSLWIMSLLIQRGTIILISLWGVILDYLSPRLQWTDTKSLYSKNFKPLLIMLVSLIIGSLNIGLVFIGSPFILFLRDISLILIISFILYKFLMKKGLEVYKRV